MKPLLATMFSKNSFKHVLSFLLFTLVMQPCWAQKTQTYTVKVVDQSNQEYPYKNKKILVEANFVAGSTMEQQLHILVSGLDVMSLQASLFNKGGQLGNTFTYDMPKIHFQGICNNTDTQQAHALFIMMSDAISVDDTTLVSLQFDSLQNQWQLVTASDTPYYDYDGHLNGLVNCKEGQTFGNQTATFEPCSCSIAAKS